MKFGFGSKTSGSERDEDGEVAAGASSTADSVGADAADEQVAPARGSAVTPKKGRPTPSRREAERARGQRSGPVSAPVTRKEAREKRKAEKQSMTKEERKAARSRMNSERETRRQAMLNGDDRYVLERDRGPVRRYARDWVDTHRRPANYFMPVALVVIIFQFFPVAATMVAFFQSAFLAVILFVVVDCIFIGRTVNKECAARYGDEANTGFGLGFYAAMRAMQPKMLRTPRPRVSPGDEIPGD